MKALFLPFSVLGGFLAGLVSKKLFGLAWRAIDEQDPPRPKDRVEDHRKLALALVLEGAIAGLMCGGFDHASRHGFARLTGSWPGEEKTENE
jgi:hypothetical protein